MSQLRIYRYPEWRETPYKLVQLHRPVTYMPVERADPQEHEHRLDESISRTRRTIRELILCNRFDLFCTFTFSKDKVKDRTDYKTIRQQLSKAFNNFRNRHDPDFRYLFIPELHKDKAVHFHGVMTMPVGLSSPLKIPKRQDDGTLKMVPNTPAYMDWPYYSKKFGYFSCSWIRDNSRCASYITKYMTKDLAEWFGKNDRIVMHSQGLKRPELVDVIDNASIPDFDEHKGDKKFEFCSIAYRFLNEAADLYCDGDDYWEWHIDEVESTVPPDIPIQQDDFMLIDDPEMYYIFSQWDDYPYQDEEFKQATLWAKEQSNND